MIFKGNIRGYILLSKYLPALENTKLLEVANICLISRH